MDRKTALALAALAGGAYLISRRKGAGAGAAASPFPPGTFRPMDASKQPDFSSVTEGISEQAPDWMRWIVAPGYDFSGANDGGTSKPTSPYDSGAMYHQYLWVPASKISINTLTVGDFNRAAYFLAGAWPQGSKSGCSDTEADKIFRGVNEHLEDIASGLQIGSAIGIGLASIFGYGQGAKASDEAFGFGRGVSESRKAEVDLSMVPPATKMQLEFLDLRAAVRKDPDGRPQGLNVIELGGWRSVGCLANLFNLSWQKWDAGWAPVDITDFKSLAGVTKNGTTYKSEIPFYVEAHGQHYGRRAGDDSPSKDVQGEYWLRRAYELPWNSVEMGCALQTFAEKVYVRARMYRTIDLIRSYLMPSDPLLVEHYTDPTLAGFIESGDVSGSRYASYSYESKRFGMVRGTIFPAFPGDAVIGQFQADRNADYVPFNPAAKGDIPDAPPSQIYHPPVPVAATPATPVPDGPVPVAPTGPPSKAGAPTVAGPTFLQSSFTRVR